MKEYTKEQVENLIKNIYSEFAELAIGFHTTSNLKQIIKIEVENNPMFGMKIFKD